MSRARFVIAAALLALLAQGNAEPLPRIAIIIDDLGYQLEAGRRAIALPGPVSYAVLPGTPQGMRLARLAKERGRDVLLHLPLQAVDLPAAAEPGGIRLDMSRAVVAATFAEALATVPNAVGVSSHRGSLLTRHPGHMSWLMQEIRRREPLFFIDSYTTHESVALRVAAEQGVTAVKRDVFLDHERSHEAVARALERLKAIAERNGQAIAIGHPFPETLEVLEYAIPAIEAQGFQLVTISELLHAMRNRI